MFRKIRIAILLLILVIVAGNAWLTRLRTTDWDIPLEAVIYPVNGDGSEAAAAYIAALEKDDFVPLARFVAAEAERYLVALAEPLTLELVRGVKTLPPAAPFRGGLLNIMTWSLRMRWWAWRADLYDGPANIRIFVLYFDPAINKELDHSLGLKEGMLCVVKAFADYRFTARNNVIIAHELLHTLGATDKYDVQTGQPLFPAGYAEPERRPLHPQEMAEIMGGLVALEADRGEMPAGLAQTLIGPVTAREIGWPGEIPRRN